METTLKREIVNISCKPKLLMPDLLWVLKARSEDPQREALHYLNISEAGACCTDGRRLHLLKNKEILPRLENGSYDVKVSKDNIIFIPVEETFPDFLKVMPEKKEKQIFIDLERMETPSISLSGALIKIFRELNVGINYEFLKDVAGHCWEEVFAGKEVVVFENKNCYALIMGIRI